MHDTTSLPVLVALTTLLVACTGDPSAPDTDVTWYGDVAHIAREKCMSCHNDDAPTFSMTSFTDDVKARAALMVGFVEDGTMPPWKPSNDCNSFEDERRLTDEEKALFRAWAESGALEGNPADAPPPLEARAGLARVDERLQMAAPYTPAPPEGDVNDHHCFVLDPGLTESEQLVGFDIHPGEPGVVHHVLLYLADTAEAEALDAAESGNGYTCTGGPGANSAQVVAGWVPGMPANNYPAGTGIPFAPGQALIMQIHYNTMQTGPLPDQTAVELMYADEAAEFPAQLQSLKNGSFVIPPQTTDFTASSELVVPAKSTLWALAPHMHVLGRRALVEVERADGSNSCLIDIPDWDFNWQQLYFFDSPVGVPLEPGDRIKMSCTWDNSTSREVRWGDGTEDEMCITYGYVTAGHVD